MNIKLELGSLLGLRLANGENSTVVTSSKVEGKDMDLTSITSKIGAKEGQKAGQKA